MSDLQLLGLIFIVLIVLVLAVGLYLLKKRLSG